jgi:diadenosine tetraphosphate (Ap4A) HIT family hydrolase
MTDTAPPTPAVDDSCPFCVISAAHAPYDPLHPPQTISPTLTTPASFIALSTPHLIAFLDILPLSRGHLLLCPRAHRPKLTDASALEARSLGYHVRILSAALARATGVQDWNVLQNNGAAAAQVVAHMHYHLIPRPEIRASGRFRESFTMFGRGQREELDDDEAEAFVAELRRHVADVLREEKDDEGYKIKL